MDDDKVTLHQLSRDLDYPERRLRHKFKRLVTAGKLKEGEDFNRDNYQNEFNFQYLINPMRFLREAKLEQRAQEVLSKQNNSSHSGNQSDMAPQQSGNQSANDSQPSGTDVDSSSVPSSNQLATEKIEVGSQNTKDEVIELLKNQVESQKEIITFQKDQLQTKDTQIGSYKDYLNEQGEFDRKMFEQLVAAKDELRALAPGKPQQSGTSPELGDNPTSGVVELGSENAEGASSPNQEELSFPREDPIQEKTTTE